MCYTPSLSASPSDFGRHRFNSCRYPTKPADTARSFPAKENNHVVFIRKNKFFEVSLARPDGGELTAAELEV
jgi:carnitine O-acetyltransferase